MQTSFISFAAQTDHAVGSQNQASTQTTTADSGAKSGSNAPGGASNYSGLIMIVVLIAVFYFLLIRPQQKKQKEMRKFREALKEGDHVVTAGGIYGVIKEVRESSVLIEVDSNVTLRIDKNMIVADSSEQQAQK